MADCEPEIRVDCPLRTFVGFATLPEVRYTAVGLTVREVGE
ncbi:hypothetical protein OHT59_01570 [Streptomyces sp. NBC_00243]|nr:hypothetical protein [Streptomyces sp. NBC_00243]WRZ26228.1 hypothetical protein OHT59_01570 [Streptomyces sp. NBC_00243]